MKGSSFHFSSKGPADGYNIKKSNQWLDIRIKVFTKALYDGTFYTSSWLIDLGEVKLNVE